MAVTAFSEPGNNATGTLAVSAGASDTSLSLVSGSLFPTAVNGYHVTLGTSEIVRVTGKSGNLLTVTRGQQGTTAAAHAAGTAVRQLIGKDWITELQVATNALETAVDALESGDLTTGAVLGDVLYGSAADTLAKLAGNTTTTKKFLRQTGDGSASAAPAWDTLVAGDIPNLAASIITSGTMAVERGGTNIGSYTIGDILQASASGVLSALAAVATGNVLLSGGVGVVGSWGKVGLATHVSGTLPVANGGTGRTVNTPRTQTLADAATIATDASLADISRVQLTASRTLGVPTNPVDGQYHQWEVMQAASVGSYTITLASGAGGFAYGTTVTSWTLTAGVNKMDKLLAQYNATADRWHVVGLAQGL